MDDNHIVSALNFGFWDHLTTKRFDNMLWVRGIKHPFPNAYAANKTIRDVNAQIETIRQWRNRIAHYRSIFDKSPQRKYEEILTLIEWTCKATAQWVRDNSKVDAVMRHAPVELASDPRWMPVVAALAPPPSPAQSPAS